MSRKPPSSLSRTAQIYIATVSAVGISLGSYCFFSLFSLYRDGILGPFLLFAALTLASGRFTLKIPSVEAHFSPSEMFVFASVLLFGPEAGAITLAADSVLIAWC